MSWHLVRSAMVSAGLVAFSLALTAICPGCGGSHTQTPGQTIDVYMVGDDRFAPQEVVANRGDIVRWTNQDTDRHTVTSDPGSPSGGPSSDTDYPGGLRYLDTFTWMVPTTAPSGTRWFYHCRFHGVAGNGHDFGVGMVGVITVR